MTTAERLVIKAVIHQANIDVDEAGSEAAAATAVVLYRVSAGDKTRELALADAKTALALLQNTDLDARSIAEKALLIAGEICVYTNQNIAIEELPAS